MSDIIAYAGSDYLVKYLVRLLLAKKKNKFTIYWEIYTSFSLYETPLFQLPEQSFMVHFSIW